MESTKKEVFFRESRQESMGESNKMVKLQDTVQAKQVPLEKKKKERKPEDSTSAQLKPIEREYELEQIKCWGMKV